jgi:hypothetical protein
MLADTYAYRFATISCVVLIAVLLQASLGCRDYAVSTSDREENKPTESEYESTSDSIERVEDNLSQHYRYEIINWVRDPNAELSTGYSAMLDTASGRTWILIAELRGLRRVVTGFRLAEMTPQPNALNSTPGRFRFVQGVHSDHISYVLDTATGLTWGLFIRDTGQVTFQSIHVEGLDDNN